MYSECEAATVSMSTIKVWNTSKLEEKRGQRENRSQWKRKKMVLTSDWKKEQRGGGIKVRTVKRREDKNLTDWEYAVKARGNKCQFCFILFYVRIEKNSRVSKTVLWHIYVSAQTGNSPFASCKVSQVAALLEQPEAEARARTEVRLLSSSAVTSSVRSTLEFIRTSTKLPVTLEKVKTKI